MIVPALALGRTLWPVLTSRAGLLGMVAAGVFIFYEGLPLGPLRLIPYVGPALESFTDGRVDTARKQGAAAERILWEEARRRLLAELAEARRRAQEAIDAIETEYLTSQAEAATQLSALEEALAAEIAANDQNNDQNPACPARPAIPGGLSRALDKIGR